MVWGTGWGEAIQKRVCRYLVQRYLGHFLGRKLDLTQLDLDLSKGTATVADILIDVEALNELAESQSWPIEFVEGFVRRVDVFIPWSTILKDDSRVEMEGLTLVVRPKRIPKNVGSVFESMWSSMSSSMQLAADCLKEEAESDAVAEPVEGIELFARTIDSILCRVKVRFADVVLRLERAPEDGDVGVGLEIHFDNIDYLDEAGSDPPVDADGADGLCAMSSFSLKRLSLDGVSLYSDEFPVDARGFSKSSARFGRRDSNSEDSPRTGSPSTGETSEDRSDVSFRSDPILIAAIAGRQELKIKIKQFDEATGPKVDFRLTLSSLNVFLSPRQLRALVELATGLSAPASEDVGYSVSVSFPRLLRYSGASAKGKSRVKSKPMRKLDFERVEAQLMSGMVAKMSETNLVAGHGWSAADLDDEDDDDDEFLPLTSHRRRDDAMSESFASSESMTSSIASNASSIGALAVPNQRSSSPIRKRKALSCVEGDPSSEVSQIHIRILSVACVLLHEDILTLSASMGGEHLAASSVKRMQNMSETFFSKLGVYGTRGYSGKDLNEVIKVLEESVTQNHLRLIVTPVVIEGNDKTNIRGCITTGTISMNHVDFCECIYKPDPSDPTGNIHETIPLLVFENTDSKAGNPLGKFANYGFHSSLGKVPDIKLTYKNTQKMSRRDKKYVQPRTELNFIMGACTMEVDISIIDRMSAVFNSPLYSKRMNASFMNVSQQLSVDKINAEFYTDIKCSSPKVKVRLRFPIADLRPCHDMSRMPWWQRNVRSDYLFGEFLDVTVAYSSSHLEDNTNVKIICKQLDLHYMESEDSGIHLGRAVADGPKNLTMFLTILPTSATLEPEMSSFKMSQNIGQSMMGQSTAMLRDRLAIGPSPFSSKKMVHESDTPHSRDNKDDTDELVIPGDSEEMKEFIEFSIRKSLIQIECDLPIVSLQLQSKQCYEVLYNRINSDLLLWEPSAPKSHYQNLNATSLDPNFLANVGFQESIYPTFSTFNKLNYESDSNSSSSSESNIYYSIHEQKTKSKHRSKRQMSDQMSEQEKFNDFCMCLKIGKGILTMLTPVRDSQNRVIPMQAGEIVITAEDLTLCQVSGVDGCPKNALVSLTATMANLHHCALIPTNSADGVSLRLYDSLLPSYLKNTIYASTQGIQVKDHQNTSRELLSLAISIKPNKNFATFKTIKMTAGISNATLRYTMAESQHSVFSQLIDMFDVLDYPVPGYEPSTVITEMHIHLWDCAIDYRPLHLPLKTVSTLGSFSISSNVIAQTNTSNLRFIAEDCALFLSEEISHAEVDLRKDYVCVLDVGLFELSLRLSDKAVTKAPKIDLRASNNVIHLRTCSDTFKALCRLIDYLASDGDFVIPESDPSGADTNSGYAYKDRDCLSPSGDLLIGMSDRPPDEIRDLSKSQVQEVNEMMAEAMQEEEAKCDNDNDDQAAVGEGVEIFFFPDESKSPKLQKDLPSSKNSSLNDLSPSHFHDCNPDSHLRESLTDEAADALSLEFQEQIIGQQEEQQPPMAIVARDLGDLTATKQDTESHSSKKKVKARKSSGENTDDEFCIVGEECVVGKQLPSDIEVKMLIDEPIHIIENYHNIPVGKTDLLKAPKNFPMSIVKYTLCEMTLIWHMYGGNDFRSTTTAESKPESQDPHAGRSSSLGPTKKNVSINEYSSRYSPTLGHSREKDPYNLLPKSSSAPPNYYGVHRGVLYNKSGESISQMFSRPRHTKSTHPIPWRYKGGQNRQHHVLMELQLNKIRFQHETYPPGGTEASRQVFIVNSIEIRDRLASSQINKFLYQYTSEQRLKRENANMIVIKAVHLRPDPQLTAQECCLKVSILPLRFNIDQDALLFLINFFTQLGDDSIKEPGLSSANSGSNQSLHSIGGTSSRHSTPTHQPPVMSIGPRPPKTTAPVKDPDVMISSDCISEDSLSIKDDEQGSIQNLMDSYEAERLVSENLILLEEDFKGNSQKRASSTSRADVESISGQTTSDIPDDGPIYFRNIVFSPEVPIRLDYNGKRVDLTHGPLAGLLMGLGQLNCSELKLKKLSYRHGILGIDRLIKWALQEWLGDIKRHQLPGILGGVGPMHALVQLFQGIRDLFWLPIEQYQRDGRLVRGLQRGASSFTTSTAMAALDITARIIYLLQATAETAYDMVSPGPGLRGIKGWDKGRRRRLKQPQDIREGVTDAYHLVKEGLEETVQTLADVAIAEKSARGYSGAVGGVLRQIAPTAVAPILLMTTAAGRVVSGVRAHIAPHDHSDHRHKWRDEDDQHADS